MKHSEPADWTRHPPWRWFIYTSVFIGLLVLLSNKANDRVILWGGLIGGAVITTIFFGMNKLLTNTRGRAFVLRNIGIIWLIYIVGSIVLFVWDRIAGR